MNRLLQQQRMMPEWLQYMEAFGLKDFPMDEGYSGFDLKVWRDGDGHVESFGDFFPLATAKRNCRSTNTNIS